MRTLLAVALLLLASSSARATAATAPPAWSVGMRSSYAIMGGKRPTGGLMPTAEVLHVWTVGTARISAGGELGVFGFGDEARWIGVLGGGVVAASGRPWTVPIEIRGAVHLDFGRIPTCTNWGLCLQYVGFLPAASATLAYQPSERVSLGAFCAARRVVTLGWSGLGVEPAITGAVSW